MNIGIINYDLSRGGGSERVAVNLANKFSKENTVFLISVYNGNSFFYQVEEKVKIVTLINQEGNFIKYYISAAKSLWNCCRDNSIDILLAVGISAVSFCVYPKLRGIKLIASVHTNLFNKNHNTWRNNLQRYLSLIVSNKYITLTKRDYDNYRKRYPLFQRKIEYIYNWIEEKLIEKKAKYDIDSKVICTVCRIDRVKGIEESIEVASKARLKETGWKWLIYGSGDSGYTEELQKQIDATGLNDTFILCGRCENIDEIYPRIGLYVSTSRFEGLPMSLLEAKTYKIPIVSFDYQTGPKEIIIDGINGILIKDRSKEEMSKTINRLIRDDEARKELSDHAWDNIADFSEEKVYEKWMNLFMTVVRKEK